VTAGAAIGGSRRTRGRVGSSSSTVLSSAARAAWVIVGMASALAHADIPGLQESSLLSEAVVAGGSISLTRFTDTRSADRLAADVADAWRRAEPPVMQAQRGGWRTLTRLDGSVVETIELRPVATGSEGRRIRWRGAAGDGDGIESAGWIASLLPAGSRTELPVTHRDGGRLMTTIVATTAASLGAIEARLRAGLRREGFREITPSPDVPGRTGSARVVVRGTEELAVTVSDHAGYRAVVLHWGRRR